MVEIQMHVNSIIIIIILICFKYFILVVTVIITSFNDVFAFILILRNV